MELPNQNFVLKVGKNSSVEIRTPGISSLQAVCNEILKQSDKRIIMKSTYPNGFTIMMHETASEIVFISNAPLTPNPDGSYTAPTDEPLPAPNHD